MNPTLPELITQARGGSPRALGRLITHVENSDTAAQTAVQALHTHTGRAHIIGITGPPGSGKSSLVKACLNEFAPQGLRLIEVDKSDMVDLPDLVELVANRPERFIVFCDDLSFEDGEPGYKALKSILDGSISVAGDNVLIYATSNRRHLLPEYMKENLSYTHTDDGEVHPGEVVEEKISLSERFGLWISFYPFSQPEYLMIVAQWLRHFGVDDATIATARQPSLLWALERGSRSGRVAYQFARDWAGRDHGADELPAPVADDTAPDGLDRV